MVVGWSNLSQNRWSKCVLEWRLHLGKRNVGRCGTARRGDDILKVAGIGWMQRAQDRAQWRAIGEAYVQQWTGQADDDDDDARHPS